MASLPFKHSRLDTSNSRAFRVLELLPSRNLEGNIRCELHHRTLGEDPDYEALSYAWGDPNPQIAIVINGSNVLSVTKNCYEALFHLRQRFHRRLLWIDAICIDQNDNDDSIRERNHQVRFMSEIYAQAKTVLVWLRCAKSGTARTFARLRLIGTAAEAKERLVPSSGEVWRGHCEYELRNKTHAEIVSHSPLITRVRQSALESLTKVLLGDMMHKPCHPVLANVLGSPWWNRLWTLQEHVFGRERDGCFGRQRIPFRFVEEMPLQLGHFQPGWLPHALPMYIIRAQIGRTSRGMKKLDEEISSTYRNSSWYFDQLQFARDLLAQTLFRAAFWFDTSRTIDRIYGLYTFLGVCFDFPLPELDYEKTTAEVFEEVIWAWVRSRSDVSILKLAGRPEGDDDVPSWVPAWHRKHPNLIEKEGPRTDGFQMGLPQLFLNTPFSWMYTKEPRMIQAARDDVQKFGPIARQISPGRLQISRARYAGRVGIISTRRNHNDSFDPIHMAYIQMTWCRIVLLISSPDQRNAMISEFFKSTYMPGIKVHRFYASSMEEERLEAFRAWFGFMVHMNDHGLQSPILDDDVEHYLTLYPEGGPDRTRLEQAARFYAEVWLAIDENAAVAMLETRFSGTAETKASIRDLARHIRGVGDMLRSMRNHALCVIGNGNMLGISNYWCLEGDEVFVFPGSDTPFLVRREFSYEGTCYRLVGPVLVDRLRIIGYQKWRAEGDDLHEITLI